MTAPRTDPQSTVPVEPLSAEEARARAADAELILCDCGPKDRPFEARPWFHRIVGTRTQHVGMTDCERDRRWLLATLDAARASQPVTALVASLPGLDDRYDARYRSGYERFRHDAIILAGQSAALPVREDEPTGIDVERLATAICASREPGIPATADLFVDDDCRRLARLVAAQYAELTREASHVR